MYFWQYIRKKKTQDKHDCAKKNYISRVINLKDK